MEQLIRIINKLDSLIAHPLDSPIVGILGPITIIIGVGLAGTIFGNKPLSSYLPTQAVCYELLENVRQANRALALTASDDHQRTYSYTQRVESDLEALCSSEEKLKALMVQQKPDCQSFLDAYSTSGRTQIPAYILCDMER
jgi:hypothetical protein